MGILYAHTRRGFSFSVPDKINVDTVVRTANAAETAVKTTASLGSIKYKGTARKIR